MTLSQLVAGLRERGHGVQVVRPIQRDERAEPRETDRELLMWGMPLPSYPEIRLGVPCRAKLVAAWRRFRPDIVHVATEGPLGISAINAADLLQVPCVSSFHTNFHSYSEHYGVPFLNRMVLGYLRWIHNRTRCSMAPTAELVAELSRDGFRNARVLGRGVNLAVFNPQRRDEALRRAWGCDADTLVLTHVSRLAAEKNYDLLARIYAAIAAARPNSRFVVVGDGPLRRKLPQLMPQAIFAGGIDLEHREDLARIYASSDLFVYPSVTETYGNVVTEAMACGLPVVAYDYAAGRLWIRHGENGLLAPLGDAAALQAAALRVAVDAALGRRLGEAAAITARAFDWNAVIDVFEATLLEHAGSGVRGALAIG